MKIAFFGTGEFSKNIAKILIEDFSQDIEIKYMVSQPDKPVGRKKILTKTPLKVLAGEKNINILQPTKLKNNIEFSQRLEGLDFIIVVAYGKIIPKEILEIPKYGCINIHGSILPQYRGASPIQESIKNGDTETGITIMYMSEGMDEGDILKIQKVDINANNTTEDIFKKFEDIGPKLLVETLKKVQNGEIKGTKQDESQASYCSKIDKADGQIDFTQQTAQEIYNQFRAYSIWPGIYTYYKGKKLSIEDCEIFETPPGSPSIEGEGGAESKQREQENYTGKVLQIEKKKIGVACKQGILIFKQIKLEGKKSMDILSFINGNKEFLDYNF